MEEFQENLKEAARRLQIAAHMTYLTYPMINDKRILLKIFKEIFNSINCGIRAALFFEAKLSDVSVYSDNEFNMQLFVNKFSKFYELEDRQIGRLMEIYELNKIHEDSAMEFVKKEKMVIMSDNLGLKTMDIQKIKEYLFFAKEFLKSINERLKIED